MKKIKKLFALLMVLAIFTSLIPTALAAETNFPLMAANGELVADQNTRYITTVEQDPDTKLITTTLQIANEGNRNIVIAGAGFQLTFDERLTPYRYDPTDPNDIPQYDITRMYVGGLLYNNTSTFKQYSHYPIEGFSTVGSTVMQNDSNLRTVAARVSCADPRDLIVLAPGKTTTIMQFFFMPTNGTDILDETMLNYQFTPVRILANTTWIGNGTRFLVSNRKFPQSSDIYVVSGNAFKLHFVQHAPKGLAADNDARVITGYDSATMEWAHDEAGPYKGGTPEVLDDAHTMYVRTAGSAYSGNDPEYGAYKRYLPSASVPVEFEPSFFSCENDVSLTKTSKNITTADGKTHVGDTIEYTITAKNAGHVKSTWADAVMTDEIPDGSTFVNGSVTIDGAPAGNAASFDNNTLKVTLGNIPGGTEKTVVFKVTVDDDAYGKTIKNSVIVNGKDGEGGKDLDKETDDGDGNKVVDRSPKPAIDPILEGDDKITGKGVAGAEIVVTFPDGSTKNATVDSQGKWEVTAPPTLKKDDEVSAIQTVPGLETSESVTAVVGARPKANLTLKKTSEDETSTDGKVHVNDTIKYTLIVGNDGDSRSIATGTVLTDTMPDSVTFVPGSVLIGGSPAPDGSVSYDNGVLTVTVGDLPGKMSQSVSFKAKVNADAYGAGLLNEAVARAKDAGTGEDLVARDDDSAYIGGKTVVDRSDAPVIDDVIEGDRKIYGDGVPGATVTVTLVDAAGATRTATVNSEGRWEVDVPTAVNLIAGNKITATQVEPGKERSEEVETIVQKKPLVVPYTEKISENITTTDGKTHVGDTIKYTITLRNDGAAKSLWKNIVLKDTLPEGVTLVPNTVIVNGSKVPYSYSDQLLTVNIPDLAGGDEAIVIFEAKVDPDAYGKFIRNTAIVTGKDEGGGKEIEEEIKEEGGHEVVEKSEPPTIDHITREDEIVTGEGIPGSEIIVTMPDGKTQVKTTVDNDGKWSIDVPNGIVLDTGDVVTAIQVEKDKDPSDKVTAVVSDKNYRAVHGFVSPMVTNDLPIDGFLEKHDIVVELRSTFLTSAPKELSTVSVIVDQDSGLGEFTIENVPFGTYVLYINRPGHLTRAMMVTVSASDPDMIELAPPGTEDDGVFNLIPGDTRGQGYVDNLGIMKIVQFMELSIDAYDEDYDPACDINADGMIDNLDIMIVIENWSRERGDYAGAEDIDFWN